MTFAALAGCEKAKTPEQEAADRRAQCDAVYRFMETNAPALMSQQNQVMDSYMTSMSALKVPKRAVQEGINPYKLREIHEAEERAMEAQRSFEAGVS